MRGQIRRTGDRQELGKSKERSPSLQKAKAQAQNATSSLTSFSQRVTGEKNEDPQGQPGIERSERPRYRLRRPGLKTTESSPIY